jgi:hypothetical protein
MNNPSPFMRLKRVSVVAAFAGAVTLLSGVALAQDDEDITPTPGAMPMFAVLPNVNPVHNNTSGLPTFTGSFTFNGSTYTYQMVGNAPSTNTSATIPVYIIPLKIVISTGRFGFKKTTFDPMSVPSNTGGLTALQNTVQSPIFDSTTTYMQGGVDVGTTQYIDAFQRANFWGQVSSNTNDHWLLGMPTLLSEVTLKPTQAQGKIGAPFGESVALVDINYLDAQLNSLITSLGIQPNSFPIFMTYKTYLTSGGQCCIGGYHSATGAQTYTHFTYIDVPGKFSQDVSALSHEIGEWLDDPLINGFNNTPCGVLEDGDPLERNPNFGGFPYVLHGFTFNLQDLVLLPYFGAPPSTSVNGFFTFQGESLTVCQNGA